MECKPCYYFESLSHAYWLAYELTESLFPTKLSHS